MRFVWTILALMAATSASAESRLKLTADRPVVIVVNMVPHTIDGDSPAIVLFKTGKEGTQRVTVRNLAGQVVHQGTIVVPKDQMVVVAWRDREFKVVERKMMRTSFAFNNSRGSRRGKAGHKRLDELAETPEETGDLLSLAASGSTETSVQDTGMIAEPEPEPAEQRTVEGSGEHVFSEGKGTSQDVETKSIAGSDSGQTAKIKLVPRTQSWSNVWIGDQKVWEFRAKSDVLELELPAGSHTVKVMDFRDKNLWGTGTLVVTPGETSTIQFSMADPIEVKGGSWTPAE